MNLTPSGAFDHVKESVVEYLETAYKIAHPAVFAERAEMLRARGVIAQSPFIEATPAFPAARKLAELERAYPDRIPAGLAELVQHGVPVDRFPLYTHQEEALVEAAVRGNNLLVATGTGSGKTESFLLPVLADILRESRSWTPTAGPARRGEYDARGDVWLPSRRHETRPAALRAVILYPMNALVNDQLSRLRRILARDSSPAWQRRNLAGNVVHFAMYTSASKPTGAWTDARRRARFDEYLGKLVEDWQGLRPDLRDTGFWPRPDSPEMLCRWDIQSAPPDILVTNYSMLEYMLVRPIEDPIFERTRQWLAGAADARFTLVLDEAHTYTGAKGTEVAFLVRRLKERLGIPAGSPQFRAIATTASVPNVPGGDGALREFTADLFGEPRDRFALIRASGAAGGLPERAATPGAMAAFRRFYRGFSVQDPVPAIRDIAEELGAGRVDPTQEPQVALHDLLESNQEIAWTRQRTARRATLLDDLAAELWQGLGTPEERAEATAGVLAAGSFARPSEYTDTPPLLSMRIHGFFRGIAGIWACMNPECPEVPPRLAGTDGPRPVGKLYTDPRCWCSDRCGGRVLEVFTCRQCGLLFLGGIPDARHGSLWPWSDDLSGERQNVQEFHVFGAEAPHAEARPEYRSVRTTLAVHPNDPHARPVYEIEGRTEDGVRVSNFPAQCPRCQHYRQMKEGGREIIEPLRTKGPRAFSAIVEDGFRVQPRARNGEPPNYGRKALLFADSRQDAAILAADLRTYHHSDLFRQLLYRALYACDRCAGRGEVEERTPFVIGQAQESAVGPCPDCGGHGAASAPRPLAFEEVRARVIAGQIERGIDPTGQKVSDYFAKTDAGDARTQAWAETAFNVNIRREIAEDEFALEPLGLAAWRAALPDRTGAFPALDDTETQALLRVVARVLATENVLLPPEPYRPWEWPPDLVPQYHRNVLIWGYKRAGQAIPYNTQPTRKLGRYLRAVSRALVREGRLPDAAAADRWVRDLQKPLWDALRGFGILEWAGAKVQDQVPHGIRVDRFVLHPIADNVQRCRSCAYVMGEAPLGVCARCGHRTEEAAAGSVASYYRRAALYARPGGFSDDPYPLRSIEHTAQIPGAEARDIERWFQDLFHDDQNRADHRVDVLSVTTTMEMGIDIGSLLCVGLRNVPPTVANYQQRAGRAGRRGSSVATVLTFAQPKSHDQYYFASPPEIVTEPPRVPALYLGNEVIARRHFRSVVLQAFFRHERRGRGGSDLFGVWGTVADYANRQTSDALLRYLARNRAPLLVRCAAFLPADLAAAAGGWLDGLPAEVQDAASRHDPGAGLLEALMASGLLPKYAFPIDVVSLTIPDIDAQIEEGEATGEDASMQRDLKIALAEYAPGGEVIRGSFPRTFVYRSAGVYDPFASEPDYSATGVVVECLDCQSIELTGTRDPVPLACRECQSLNLSPLPYLRPAGFTVDAALPEAGRVEYEGGGRERAGYAAPARLHVGETSFHAGRPHVPAAPSLYSLVRVGDLFMANRGPDRQFPGFLICPDCGRSLDPDATGAHRYPADVPPHTGRDRGPRAGDRCPNRGNVQNQVLLGHRFHSEVVLLGVDLPETMDAPFTEPSGRAAWYSFGTLLSDAAARVLQINPGELKVGVRASRRSPGRVHGEVFLYDDVPGGAGYARAIERNLAEILGKALDLGRNCPNPACAGACYHCLYEYGNQSLHPLLDRGLGTGILAFVLEGRLPVLGVDDAARSAAGFIEFARASWDILPARTAGGHRFPCVLRDPSGQEYALWPVHPLAARPGHDETQTVLAEHGLRCAVHTTFDLERRPFWVFNNLVRAAP